MSRTEKKINKILILPHQLYDKKKIPKTVSHIYMWEHPQYFTQYKYNKKRLVLHRASLQSYMDYLRGNSSKYTIKYYTYDDDEKKILDDIKGECYMFDPIDNIKFPNKSFDILESPNFLLSRQNMKDYRLKTESFLFNNFYLWSKKELNIEPSLKSTDKQNRKSLPKNINIPAVQPKSQCKKDKYVLEAIKYVETRFPNNYGNTDYDSVTKFCPPINHLDAKKLLKHFISNKFKEFGPYQDAVVEKEPFLFHSMLSSSINIGLINPLDIIEEIKSYKSKIPINSYEAFIRQLFWREYQRYCYNYARQDMTKLTYFNNKKKLTKAWYTGKLGVPPVDDAIKLAFESGYLHHIQRLMIIGNFMNLSQIDANDGFKWFMEFSLDSYEWVMHQNVYDMVFFNTGGLTMRRPYVSSSNYVLKMSDYKKGDWVDKWDKLYENFMKRNKAKLHKFRYYFPGLSKYK